MCAYHIERKKVLKVLLGQFKAAEHANAQCKGIIIMPLAYFIV